MFGRNEGQPKADLFCHLTSVPFMHYLHIPNFSFLRPSCFWFQRRMPAPIRYVNAPSLFTVCAISWLRRIRCERCFIDERVTYIPRAYKITGIVTHTDDSRGVRFSPLFVCVFVCLSVCLFARYLRSRCSWDHQTWRVKFSTTSPGNSFILGSKGQRSRLRHTKTVPAWVIALWLVRAGFFQFIF